MRTELAFGAQSSRGTRALKTAGLWPRIEGLQSLRLGVGFRWGLGGLFREEFQLRIARNSVSTVPRERKSGNFVSR